MLDDVSLHSVRDGLRRVCQNRGLPTSARTQASQILTRFEAGVRVFVLGPEAAGKSILCNGLVGLPECEETAAVTRVFHTSENIVVPDESVLQRVQIRQKRIDPVILGPVSLIDVHIPSDPPTAKQIYGQVFKEADVVIWCTQEFGRDEAEVWAQASDALKDHSFLVLSNADCLPDGVVAHERMTELQFNFAGEFHSMFFTAMGEDAKRHTTLTSASKHHTGVPALRNALKRLIVSGRDADIDGAMLFLDRYGADEPADDTPVIIKEESNQTPNAGHPALPYLQARAFDLAEMAFDEAAGDLSEVLRYCVVTAEELVSLVENETAGAGVADEWEIAFEDAADKIVLLAAENNTRSAADAITILLQMRRDLSSFAHLKACA